MNKKYDNNNIIIASRAYFLHLRHDVGKLLRCWDMENSKVPERNLLSDKMNVELDMLCATVMDGVRRHVDR
jgi:hypothetical protein